MARSLDELYTEIARLPAADRLRLAARILNELASETPAAAAKPALPAPPPAPVKIEKKAARANGRERAGARERGGGAEGVGPGPREGASGANGGARFLVVDGSNLLGRLPGFELNSPASREKLALRLQEYAHAHPRTRVTLYFDGQQASATQRGGIEIRYSPGTQPADYFIIEYLGRLKPEQRANARLVTADRELGDNARALGVTVEAPEQFQRQIAGPPRAPADRGLSKAEIAEWEEYFRQRPEEH
jgi:YacP-like NYN domain